MTQQPYGQPYPQQPYPAQPQQPPAPQYAPPAPQGYPQQAPQYAPPPAQAPQYAPQQGYGQQPPAGPPPVALADGSIDAFYNQPNTGGGPGVSWKGKPDGYTVQGAVKRDVTNADVTQEVGAPNTQEAGKPQFYRDGRPKFVMAIPLMLQPSQEYPEGEARLFVRGQLRDELARAMGEASEQGAPKAGAVITVTLRERKQGRGAIPQNIFSVVYTPAGGPAPQVQQPQPQAAPQYAQQAPQQQYQQPPQAPQGYQQPPVQPQAPQYPQQAPQQAAPQPQAPEQPAQQAPQQAAPQPQAPQGQPIPSDFTPEQAALMQQITGQPAG